MMRASVSEAFTTGKLDTGAPLDNEKEIPSITSDAIGIAPDEADYTEDSVEDIGDISGEIEERLPYSGTPLEESEEKIPEDTITGDKETADYSAIIERELAELRRAFPELKDLRDITELENPMRYAALRDLGLSTREAYLATTERRIKRDNRAHLSPATPRRAGSPGGTMSREELRAARELFSGMGDGELQALYRRVAR